MDRNQIRNGIIKRMDKNDKYLYSFYGFDNNKNHNVLIIISKNNFYVWEDFKNSLKVRVKKYQDIVKINYVREELFINFQDENFQLKNISKEDGETIYLYKFVRDLYEKSLDSIASKTRTNRNQQQTVLPPQEEDIDYKANDRERLNSLRMFLPINEEEILRKQQNKQYQENTKNNVQNKQQIKNSKEKNRERPTANKNKVAKQKDSGEKNKFPIKIILIPIIVLVLCVSLFLGVYFIFLKDDGSADVSSNTVTNTSNNEKPAKKPDNSKEEYTSTKKEAETKIEDLNNLQEILKKDKIIYSVIQQNYDKYKENIDDFDFDAAKNSIQLKIDENKEISIDKIDLKSSINGNVEGNYLFSELKKNQNLVDELITSVNLNLENKFNDNGRIVEFETLLENLSSSNKKIASLIKDELNIFNKELEKYGQGSINDDDDTKIDVENNDELIGNSTEE